MGEVKQNHPKVWKDTGKGVGDVGEKTQEAWEKLKGESEGMGDIFGDDMVGGLIGGAYQAIFELADESFTSAADDYKAFGEGMNEVGQMHEDNQKANIQLIAKIASAGVK